jgi:hypothetical protein
VRGALESIQLPSCLLVTVDGLCPNWDAGLLDLKTNELRRFGTLEGRGYFTLAGTGSHDFAAGNLLTCHHPDVRLNLKRSGEAWVVDAHNPTEANLETTIVVPDWLTILPRVRRTLALPAGSTTTILFE